jgi:hypothetical protein
MSSTPGIPEYQIPNEQVAAHANQIADAAVFLFEHIQEVNCVPSVLLESAFAIELFLKSLSSRTVFHPLANEEDATGIVGFQITAKPTANIHALEKLFDAIDEPIREELQEAYKAAPAIPGVALLRDALARYSNLFAEIRYYFERCDGGGNNITHLIRLLKFIRHQVANMPRRYRYA